MRPREVNIEDFLNEMNRRMRRLERRVLTLEDMLGEATDNILVLEDRVDAFAVVEDDILMSPGGAA
jgi:hypothetical protein